jgi:hypothetical protein
VVILYDGSSARDRRLAKGQMGNVAWTLPPRAAVTALGIPPGAGFPGGGLLGNAWLSPRGGIR